MQADILFSVAETVLSVGETVKRVVPPLENKITLDMSMLSKSRSKFSDTSENSEEDEEEKEEAKENDKLYNVWQYFTKIYDKEAKCNFCGRVYTYRTTISNLKSHLATKHIEHFPNWKELHIRRQFLLQPYKLRPPKRPRVNQSYLWDHFRKVDDSRAECSFCEKVFSYKTTIHNLKMHLVRAHPTEVPFAQEKHESAMADESIQYSDANEEEVTAEPIDQVPSDASIGRYFEREAEGITRCSLCEKRTSVTCQRQHLSKRHPKVLAALVMQASDDEDEKPTQHNTRSSRHDPLQTTPNDHRRKRKAHNPPQETSSDEETPLAKRKEPESKPDLFLQYLSTLLSDLTPEVYLQLQMDMINLVMKARIGQEKSKCSNEVVSYQIVQMAPQIKQDGGVADASRGFQGSVNSTVPEPVNCDVTVVGHEIGHCN